MMVGGPRAATSRAASADSLPTVSSDATHVSHLTGFQIDATLRANLSPVHYGLAWLTVAKHFLTMLLTATARRVALRGAPCSTPRQLFVPNRPTRNLLSTLAVLEQRDGKLNNGSLSAIVAAKKLGGSVHGFVAGADVKAVAQEAAQADGVEKIVAVSNAAYEKVSLI